MQKFNLKTCSAEPKQLLRTLKESTNLEQSFIKTSVEESALQLFKGIAKESCYLLPNINNSNNFSISYHEIAKISTVQVLHIK